MVLDKKQIWYLSLAILILPMFASYLEKKKQTNLQKIKGGEDRTEFLHLEINKQ